jgi:hypothetical protein
MDRAAQLRYSNVTPSRQRGHAVWSIDEGHSAARKSGRGCWRSRKSAVALKNATTPVRAFRMGLVALADLGDVRVEQKCRGSTSRQWRGAAAQKRPQILRRRVLSQRYRRRPSPADASGLAPTSIKSASALSTHPRRCGRASTRTSACARRRCLRIACRREFARPYVLLRTWSYAVRPLCEYQATFWAPVPLGNANKPVNSLASSPARARCAGTPPPGPGRRSRYWSI